MMTNTTGPTYTLSSSGDNYQQQSRKTKGSSRRRTLSEDEDDGNGSMTYSAGSSVQSGSSAGESTNSSSSFAGIMRVLDVQDSQELIKKEGVSSAEQLRAKRGLPSSSAISVASSLNYSTDGESHMQGAQLLQTIAGQPLLDGGGSYTKEKPFSDGNDILFAPALPGDVKKKKRNKKNKNANTTPKAKNSTRERYDVSPSPSQDTPTKSPPSEKSDRSTPPPLPPKTLILEDDDDEEEDIWYAKWWIACFPDAFKNLMPKR